MIQAPRRRPHEASGTPSAVVLIDCIHAAFVGAPGYCGAWPYCAGWPTCPGWPWPYACGAWPCHPLPCGIGVVGIGTPWVAAAPVESVAASGGTPVPCGRVGDFLGAVWLLHITPSQ